MRQIKAAVVLGVMVMAIGCGPSYYEDFGPIKFSQDAQVAENQRNQEILEVVRAYHTAVEERDVATLRRL
ncbi:MAG: hypothetical protein AAFS10_27100, partial [Myxococcota bacterium]